jgi:hypothetical protein
MIHEYATLPGHDPSKVRGYTAPTLCGLLSDAKPLPDQLRTASEQLRGMLDAGELDALAPDTRVVFVALAMFLHGAAARVGGV